MSDRIGEQLGNYRLIRLLGQERTAEVYLGEHVHQKAFVTIKVPHMSLDAGSQENLLGEARLLTRLEHPNIERILEVDIQNTTPFLVTEYAPGGTLRKRHSRGVPLTLAQIVSYVKQVSSALQYMHEHNLIHRDVKPENMLLGANDKVLLSDLGIAVLSHISASFSSPELSGSLAYMAPEQLQGQVQKASDQYSLAIVVYEWLTGRPPFQGSFAEIVSQHLSTPPPSLRATNPSVPPDVEQVVMIALSKDPRQRFASLRAFATAFEQAANLGQELLLFAIARTTVDGTDRAIVGDIYTLEAGIFQHTPENFSEESIKVRTQNAADPLVFDILIHTGDNIELMSAWYQQLRYTPGSAAPQFITCPFRLKAPGRCELIVHFYRERQWLKAIRFEFILL